METGVPQRDFRVWLHPKRRLACPLRRLPMKPNGPRRRCRIECLEEAPFYAAVSMTTVQSATPYRQRKRSRGSFAAFVCDVTSRLRNESTVLHMIRAAPWRRGAPKAQDRCASKRHPSTQRSVWQLCKALLRIVIGSEAVGSLPHSYETLRAG